MITLSTTAFPGGFPHRVKLTEPDDWEMGGVAIGDTSQGLLVKLWHCFIDGNGVYVEADGVPKTLLFTAPGVSDVSLAFDQSMRPVVAYVQAGVANLWWYDPAIPGETATALPGATTPRCTLDDKRSFAIPNSNVYVVYLKGRDLYYRQQSDRYAVEYLLATDVGSGLSTVAMGTNNRLHFGVGEA